MMDNRSEGIVYLVGAGPGNPGLITRRALEVMARAETVVYDYLVNPVFLDDTPEGCERIYVGKKAGAHTMGQENINKLLVEKCREGRVVVRLKGGDPYVFGRGGEEALALARAGQRFEIVPGITAGIAAAAYAGIPVTQRGYTCTLTFVTGHEDPEKADSDIDWPSLAVGGGTLVFYMGVGNLPLIVKKLVENGRSDSTPVALVRWGSWPRQRTVTGTLADISEKVREAKLKPPALIIVGETVALRDELNWFETRPLFGRRVIVTRSRVQAGDLSRRIEEIGGEVVEFPVIRNQPPDDPGPLEDAVCRADAFDWIVFTSVNGVDAFFDALRAQGRDARALGGVRVCAIGPATAQRVESRGVAPNLVPPKYVAESIAEEFEKRGKIDGLRFLLPCSAIARTFLPEALERLGAHVERVAAYTTVIEEPDNIEDIRSDLLDGSIAAVTFTSSSTAQNFAQLVGEETMRALPETLTLASIGPETTKALKKFTDREIVQSEEYTMSGVVELLLQRLGGANE